MISENLMQILRSPIVSEKTARIQEKSNQFAFEVAATATKEEVKRAVEELFKVNVTAVNVVNVKGKVKAFRGRMGVRKGYRKAYISLKDGQSIDVLGKP